MIGVLGPKLVREEGGCNGCNTRIGGDAAEVFFFQSLDHEKVLSFRLCEPCVLALKATLTALWPDEAVG